MEFRNCFICNALRTPSFQGEWPLDCHIVWCFKIFWARGRACQSWSDASYVEGQPNLTCWILETAVLAVSSYTCSDSVCVVPRSSKVRISTRLNGCKILSWYFACVLDSMGCLWRLYASLCLLYPISWCSFPAIRYPCPEHLSTEAQQLIASMLTLEPRTVKTDRFLKIFLGFSLYATTWHRDCYVPCRSRATVRSVLAHPFLQEGWTAYLGSETVSWCFRFQAAKDRINSCIVESARACILAPERSMDICFAQSHWRTVETGSPFFNVQMFRRYHWQWLQGLRISSVFGSHQPVYILLCSKLIKIIHLWLIRVKEPGSLMWLFACIYFLHVLCNMQ